MPKAPKKVGVFLGRLQPQHRGHENLIETIFRENDEVVLCVGSAQRLRADDPARSRNPLSTGARVRILRDYLEKKGFSKPYRIVTARDIQPDSAWPLHLKRCCHLRSQDHNRVYYSDPLRAQERAELEAVGLLPRFTRRIAFDYRDSRQVVHRVSSATEIRALEEAARKKEDT